MAFQRTDIPVVKKMEFQIWYQLGQNENHHLTNLETCKEKHSVSQELVCYEDGADFLVQIASQRDRDDSDEESDELYRRMNVIPRRFQVSKVSSD